MSEQKDWREQIARMLDDFPDRNRFKSANEIILKIEEIEAKAIDQERQRISEILTGMKINYQKYGFSDTNLSKTDGHNQAIDSALLAINTEQHGKN